MSGKYDISLPEGTDIGGYRLLRVLGDGGFGITYLAENFLGEKFAIKEYLPNQFAVRHRTEVHPRTEANREDFEWGRRRFVKEADLLRRFKHQNIVKVKHFLEMNNTAYIVMEYEDGEPLDEKLRRREKEGDGRLTEAELKHILFPIAEGLRDVHREGVCHRDIKPANIFVRRSDGSPVLLDFGAARNALGWKSMSVAAIVSPPYSPPEQYDYEAVLGPSTDIYAFSALCYRAITGEPPAESPRRQGRVYKGEEDPLRALTEAEPPGYSRALLKAVDWGLRLDEKERPQSVEEWLVAMEGARTPPPSPRSSNNDAAMRNEEAWEKPDDDNAGSEQEGVEREAEAQAQPRRSGLAKDGFGTGVFRKMKIMRGKYGLVGLVGVFLGFAVSALVLLFGAQSVVDKLGLRPAPHVAPPPAPIESDPPAVDPLKRGGGRTPDTRPIAVPTPPPTDPEPPRPILDCPTCPPFTVRTGPPDARVQIMNIGPRYEPGIKLPPGSYDVRVTAQRRPANGTFTAREFDTVERTLQHDDEQKDRWIGVPFYDCPVCPKMVELPKGSYTMGTSKEEDISRLGAERYSNEGPAHLVEIRYRLAVGVFEVSFKEWDACVANKGCTRRLQDEGRGRERRPAVHATLADAKEYAHWLTVTTGRQYRLLSEAEWEYAARAGESSGRHWGLELKKQCDYENGADLTAKREYVNWTVADCADEYVYAAPSNETGFRSNPWGLHHMLGNVSEWTADCWHWSYHDIAPFSGARTLAARDGSAWTSDCDPTKHVARGGSWASWPRDVRAPRRLGHDPAKGSDIVGFRVAVVTR